MEKQEKVMEGLRACSIGVDCGERCPYEAMHEEPGAGNCIAALCRDALELLDALKPRLMTEEEANELAWDYCYLEEETFSGKHKIKCITWPSIASAKITYGAGAYGKKWRCWTQQPTDEQRKLAKWE